MSKNLFKKGLAFGAVLALGATGFTGIAATAAAGDVVIAPSTGSGYTAFATDSFALKTSIGGGVSATNLAYRISNPDQKILKINVGTLGAAGTIVTTGFSSTGAEVAVADTTSGTSTSMEVDFATLGITDLVLSSIDNAAAVNNIINVQVLEATSNDTLDYGDGGASVKVQSWVESEASADYSTVDAGFASAQETVTFIDPSSVSVIAKVERVVGTGLDLATPYTAAVAATSMNSAGQDFLTGSLQFSAAVNLDQVDLAKWKYAVDSSTDADDRATAAVDLRASGEAWATADHNMEILTPAGYSATNKTAFGKLIFRGAVTGDDIAVGATYKVSFRHGSDTAPFNDFNSAAFEVVDNTAGATANNVTGLVTSTVDAAQTAVTDTGIDARAGISALTYKAQIRTAADAALAAANVPVAAVVTAGTYFPTGESITVSGTTEKISKASGAVITTGLTNADGNWSVTVSSTTAKASQSYVVEFYVLDSDGIWQNTRTNADDASDYTTTYAAATPTTFSADSAVLSGANPAVAFTVKDQFGQAISATSTGTALNVELKAPDKTKLEKYTPVSAGTASFTFANYLPAGQSDVLTAKVYTGSSTSPTYVGSLSTTVSLYNTNAIAAVNVVSEVTGVEVTYEDFITGASSSTNVAPGTAGAVDFTYTGTVVDANGAGVPGAPVTISGKGFQFVKTGTTTYSVDSITVAASEAGTFSVTGWTTVLSSTGNVLTVKSGDKTATTKIKSVLPTSLSTKNLQLTWDAPAAPVMNTTYAVTATLADKWGNPIAGATLDFNGYAAAQFNGVATATKVTGSNGKAVAYLRSLKDVDGVSAIGLELKGTTLTWTEVVSTVHSDSTSTKWDESKWSNVVEKTVTFAKTAPVVATTNASGSTGKFYASATNAAGKKVVVKVNGVFAKSFIGTAAKKVISVTASKGTKTITIYVGGKLSSTKVVIVK